MVPVNLNGRAENEMNKIVSKEILDMITTIEKLRKLVDVTTEACEFAEAYDTRLFGWVSGMDVRMRKVRAVLNELDANDNA